MKKFPNLFFRPPDETFWVSSFLPKDGFLKLIPFNLSKILGAFVFSSSVEVSSFDSGVSEIFSVVEVVCSSVVD